MIVLNAHTAKMATTTLFSQSTMPVGVLPRIVAHEPPLAVATAVPMGIEMQPMHGNVVVPQSGITILPAEADDEHTSGPARGGCGDSGAAAPAVPQATMVGPGLRVC